MTTSQKFPRINVLIASYNYEDWVVGSIMSAVNQTYPNLGIIVVDADSKDASWKNIIESFFSGKHERVYPSNKEIRKADIKNKYGNTVNITAIKLDKADGPSATRNFGIDYSIDSCDMYAILDADDEMVENKVMRLYREIQQQPNYIGVAYGDYTVLNIKTGIMTQEIKEAFSKERLLQSNIVHSGSLVTCKALRDIKDENGYYDNQLMVAEDWDLWIRIAKKYMILHVPELLTLVRSSAKDTTNSIAKETWNRCWKRIGDKVNGIVR